MKTGDPTTSAWSCGLSIGLIDDIPTCKELIESMVTEAESIIQGRLTKMVHTHSKL